MRIPTNLEDFYLFILFNYKGDKMLKKRHLNKFLGYVATLAILFVSISPKTFNIPLALQPWVFMGSIAWFTAFSSGVFNS